MKVFKSIITAATILVAATVTAATPVTLTWSLAGGSASNTTAVTTPDGQFSVASFSTGSNLRLLDATRNLGGTAMSQFQPVATASGNDAGNAVSFVIKPKLGLTMTPSKLSFKTARIGTDGGEIAVGVVAGGTETIIADKVKPTRNNATPPYSSLSYDLSTINANKDGLTVNIYIKSLGDTRQITLADVIVTGEISGEIVAVPSYTLTLGSSHGDEAGNVTCSPSGTTFDEGTAITVSATENFGYHFRDWTDAEGKVVSTDNPYTFTINGNTTLTANYSHNEVYPLNIKLEGGANPNLVQFSPEGNVVDGVHYYEDGTEVRLTTVNNRILTFTNWEDNSTSPERIVKMDAPQDVTATFSAIDYIVGWDFYLDQPNSERAADYRMESDNAGLLSLRNAEGKTTSWLTRGISNGAEYGKWGARIWKKLADRNYFELSFSTVGYNNVIVSAALGVGYNTYSTVNAQYSIDGGKTFTTFGTYNLASGWTANELALPADAAGQSRVIVRYMPDYTSPLIGNKTDNDGLAIAELFVLADALCTSDDIAPVLVSSLPADKDENVSATGSIILTFDEKIKAGNGNATLNGKPLTLTVSGKSAVFSYAGLDYATDYTFSMEDGAVTDRSGNPAPAVSLSFKTLERQQPEARLFDAIVAADGSGDYATLQSAVDAAPSGRIKPWLIFVKNGRYKGHVDIPANKPMLHIIGQDRDKAVIVDDVLCGGDNAVHVSVGATVVVKSNDCLFENITLENSWGHEKQAGPQALALNTIGDRTIFNNVAMLSYQDTWITPSTSAYRAYVRNSLIEGAVDFIYNSGDIYIDNTTLLINRKSGGYIVAPSHGTDVKWGYVFRDCTITAPGNPSETSIWLGRPWHNYPKTVFLNTRAEVTIPATGWYETMGGLPAIWADWNTTDANGNLLDLSQRRDTYYYVDNDGKRHEGKAKNHLTDEEAAQYTVSNVLSGNDNWQPVIKTEECAAPVVKATDGSLSWDAVPYAICYLVTDGDKVVGFTTETSMSGASDKCAVQAVNEFGGLSVKGYAGASGISDIVTEGTEAVAVEYYDLRGVRLDAPVPGINIVKTVCKDGSFKVEKIMGK